jgi:hypothetical protein
MAVPLSEHHGTGRKLSTHLDMPPFFYDLPFHYLNSSPLVEAWFAAPSAIERRRLIEWPSHADANCMHPCPVWKLFQFEEIPPSLYRRPGSGSHKGSRDALHPQIDFIYQLLKAAILHDNIRIKWRVRFRLLLEQARSESTALLLRRQLILSLILGDVRDVANYSPRTAIFGHSYTFTSTAEDVTCVPLPYQDRHVHHIPGFSLPVLGPAPHPPRRSFYLGVKMQIDDYRQAFSLAQRPPDLDSDTRHTAMTAAATAVATQSAAATTTAEVLDAATIAASNPPVTADDAADAPDAATIAAIKAMAHSAEIWARELIDSTRDPSAPLAREFPTLACPAPAPSDIADEPLPFLRPASCFSDDDADVASSSSESD